MKIKNFAKAVALVLTTSIVLGIAGTTRRVAAATDITLSGNCTVQKYGVIDGAWSDSASTLVLKARPGSNDPYKPIEAINVNLNNSTGYDGSLKYSVYVQSKGWQDFTSSGSDAGIVNKALKIEALKMELTGELASKYSVEYEVWYEKDNNVQGYVSDGTVAGSIGEPKKIVQIKIRIVPANQGTASNVSYRAHRDSEGWGSKWAKNGDVTGAAGKGKQIDSIELNVTGNQYKGGISYRSNIQNKGWEDKWSSNGETSGAKGLRTEAVAIKLTGDIANHYDVYYRAYSPIYGWLGWAKNGEISGTTDLSSRLEAIQIVLVAKGSDAPGNVKDIKSDVDVAEVNPRTPILPGRGLFRMPSGAKVSYAVKSADGWSEIKSDGQVLEVTGQITGIAVGVNVPDSDLQLSVDMPDFGNEKKDSNEAYDAPFDLRIIDAGKRIENLRMSLYGVDYYFDVNEETGEWMEILKPYKDDYCAFYRVKTSKYGWMAWTNNENKCGTDEIGNTISAIQIVVLPKGQTPAADLNGITSDNENSFLKMEDFPKPKLVTSGNKFASWCLKQFPANQNTLNYLSQHKRPPKYIFYSVASTWPYKLGGKTKKKCDCTGFAVWVFKNYHKKNVKFNSHSMAYKTGKTVSYKNIKPGDLLCECTTYHGDVFFYVGKDEYGHDVILDGMTPKINGKIKHVYPCLRYIDLEAWALQSKHYVRRK